MQRAIKSQREKTMTEDVDIRMNRGCDTILEAAAKAMLDMGADPSRIIDRMMTYSLAHLVSWHGSAKAGEVVHQMAGNVEAGLMVRLDPTSPQRRN